MAPAIKMSSPGSSHTGPAALEIAQRFLLHLRKCSSVYLHQRLSIIIGLTQNAGIDYYVADNVSAAVSEQMIGRYQDILSRRERIKQRTLAQRRIANLRTGVV